MHPPLGSKREGGIALPSSYPKVAVEKKQNNWKLPCKKYRTPTIKKVKTKKETEVKHGKSSGVLKCVDVFPLIDGTHRAQLTF